VTLASTSTGTVRYFAFLDQPFRRRLDLFIWSLLHESYGATYPGGEWSDVERLLIYI